MDTIFDLLYRFPVLMIVLFLFGYYLVNLLFE